MGSFYDQTKNLFRSSLTLAFVTTFSLVLIYAILPPVSRVDLLGRDLFFRVRHSLKGPPPEVQNLILVSIDDATTKSMKYKWPLPRFIYADAIEKIDQLGTPKVIGFDFVFQGEDQIPGSDQALEDALKKAGNVIVASYMDYEGQVIEGLARIQSSAYRTAFVNKLVDKDQVIRRAPIFLDNRRIGERRWSWESEILFKFIGFDNPKLKLMSHSKGIAIENGSSSIRIPSPDGVLDIDYTVRYEDIPKVSFQDVLDGVVKIPIFKDKIVLIGLTALAFHDVHPTPLDAMPGLALNANTILTLLRQNFFKRIPLFFSWLLLFLSIWLIFRVTLGYSIFKGFLLVCVMSAAYLFLDFILLWQNIIWDLWFVVISTNLMFLVALVYRQIQTAVENIRLREETVRDPLTGFYTRRFLEVHLKMNVKKALTNSRNFGVFDEVSVVMIDLDNFKLVNDSFGHQEGDRVLQRLCESILSSVRKNELVCRYGGDEFCVLLPGTPIQNALRFAEKIRLLIANDPDLNYTTRAGVKSFRITSSLGVASVKGARAINPENLLKAADKALYRAKQAGRNRVCSFDPNQDVLDGR